MNRNELKPLRPGDRIVGRLAGKDRPGVVDESNGTHLYVNYDDGGKGIVYVGEDDPSFRAENVEVQREEGI